LKDKLAGPQVQNVLVCTFRIGVFHGETLGHVEFWSPSKYAGSVGRGARI
jgi:hypothetical protein